MDCLLFIDLHIVYSGPMLSVGLLPEYPEQILSTAGNIHEAEI